jgi:hypothetical protein
MRAKIFCAGYFDLVKSNGMSMKAPSQSAEAVLLPSQVLRA